MKFGGITHVIKNPAGSFSLAGSIPIGMMKERTPTVSDVMGGRVRDGKAYVGRAYESIEEIRGSAEKCGAKLCDLPGCACRELF